MTTHYGDFQGFVTTEATAYPISYSGAGLFDMSPLAEELMDMLPSFYFLGNNNRKILELIAVVLAKYEAYIDDVRDQFFVETATWGLSYWEALVGCPVNEDSQNWEARRICILNKLRDCSSEECFVTGIESIINGQAIVTLLNPATNPYQINIELKSGELVFAGPATSPTASLYGTGPLTGDYTYRVTYEYEPVVIPGYLTLFPYTNYSGLFGSVDVIGQRQFLSTNGSGSFWLTMGGLGASAGPFTENSTAQEIVDGLVPVLETKYGPDAVSTPFPGNVVGVEGVLIVVEGPVSKGLSLPVLQVVNTVGTLSGNAVIAGNPEFIQPEITGETPSGLAPHKINEIQTLGQGLFIPASVLAPFEGDIMCTATAGMFAAVRWAGDPLTLTSTASIAMWPAQEIATLRGTPTLVLGTASASLAPKLTIGFGGADVEIGKTSVGLIPYVDSSVPLEEVGDGTAYAGASTSMSAAVQYGSVAMSANNGISLGDMADGVGPLSLLITPDSGVKFAYSDIFASSSATMTGNVSYGSAVMPCVGKASVTSILRLNPPPPPPIINPVTGGTFIIRYNTVWDESAPPIFEDTDPLPYTATAAQIKGALEALPSVYPNAVTVSGGPLPNSPIIIEFKGTESGFPQSLLVVDSAALTGGGFYEVIRNQAGHTTYSGSESNTIAATGNTILLQNVPRSPDGAFRRNIYRKKTEAPYNEWRYVGSIEDNYTALFVDDLSDEDLSEVQELQIFGTGSFKLRFDSLDTISLTNSSNASTVESAIDAITSLTYPNVDVTVVGTSPSFSDGGLTITFDGGDVVGKDVPKIEIVDPVGVTGYVLTTGPRRLTEKNTAFTYTFQRLLDYIYVTKPAHLRIRELRSAAFRASINVAGDPV
jgi:hypothetical protein